MKYNLFLFIAFISAVGFSQELTTESLDTQFNTLYRRSTSYQEYKVVSKDKFRALQKNVSDSINAYSSDMQHKISTINTHEGTISVLTKENNTLSSQLKIALKKENSISLFGIQFTKWLYSIIVFIIILLLLILLAYYIFKFKNSNVITMDAKYSLTDAEHELTIFKKKSLEREQKLRRELQDEIIKNRGN